MNLADILARIDQRLAETGLSEAAAGRAAGSAETIRNWRRAVAEGRPLSPRLVTLERVARVLGVSSDWLIHGRGLPAVDIQPGLSEPDAAPWIPATPGLAAVPGLLAPGLRRPFTYELQRDQPAMCLLRGDVLVVEQAHRAGTGDTVVVSFDEHLNGQPVTLVRRFLPPYLVGRDGGAAETVLTIDSTGRAAILGTVEASWRPRAP